MLEKNNNTKNKKQEKQQQQKKHIPDPRNANEHYQS